MIRLTELGELLRYVVQRTDRTFRFCLIIACQGMFSPPVLTLIVLALLGLICR